MEMPKHASATDDLARSLNADSLPFVYASSLATWRRDGPILFLSFVEHRPLTETLELTRCVPVARIMVPIAGLEVMIATLQDALDRIRFAETAPAPAAPTKVN